MSQNTIILIPARLGSTRFPNKPLADIKGKTMITRVCEQGKKAGISEIIVACSEGEVKQEVEKNGFKAIMTDPDLPSGTDRIYAAMQQLENLAKVDFIVNLQGDLPDIDPTIISKTIEVLTENLDADIATAVIGIEEEGLEKDPNIVKAVVNFTQNQNSARCYYFSRSMVPYNAEKFYEHRDESLNIVL